MNKHPNKHCVSSLLAAYLLALALPAAAEPYIDIGIAIHHQINAAPIGDYWLWDENRTRNPYGVIAIGYEHDIAKRLSLSLAARHESSIPVNDHGVNSLQLTLHIRL